VDDDASPTAPDTASVFSSIQQTAVALVSAATEQAAQSAARRSAIPNGLRNAVKERHEYAIQRATADQARRAAECARAAVEAIVRHTTQPCLALDETGSIVRWNDALTAWTGIRAESALNHDLAAIFSTEAAEEIHFANLALREAEELPGGVDSDPVFVLEGMFFLQNGFAAERISLLPLCRTPRVVEAIIVLVTPLSQAD
jgi:PAS domain-containing protein